MSRVENQISKPPIQEVSEVVDSDIDTTTAQAAAVVELMQQKAHEARLAEKQAAEVQAARQQVQDSHEEKPLQSDKSDKKAATPTPVSPVKTQASSPVAPKRKPATPKIVQKTHAKTAQAKPKATKRALVPADKPKPNVVAPLTIKVNAERPRSPQEQPALKPVASHGAELSAPKITKKPELEPLVPVNGAVQPEGLEQAAPQLHVAEIDDRPPDVSVALESGAEPVSETTVLMSHEDEDFPRPEQVLVHSEAGLQFVELHHEGPPDIDTVILQEARVDLGIVPSSPEMPAEKPIEKPIDIFKLPEADSTVISEEIQPKTVEVITVIQEKVDALESEQVETVELLFSDLQEAVEELTTQSDEMPVEERLHAVAEIMTEILDTLDIAYDEEVIAEIITYLCAKRNLEAWPPQLKTTQYFEEGTHERLSHVTNLFQDVKDLLEPLHTRIGRTALVSNIF